MENSALFNISYGLYLLTANENGFDNGSIINTLAQVTYSPDKISVTVNKSTKTHEMIFNTNKILNVNLMAGLLIILLFLIWNLIMQVQ